MVLAHRAFAVNLLVIFASEDPVVDKASAPDASATYPDSDCSKDECLDPPKPLVLLNSVECDLLAIDESVSSPWLVQYILNSESIWPPCLVDLVNPHDAASKYWVPLEDLSRLARHQIQSGVRHWNRSTIFIAAFPGSHRRQLSDTQQVLQSIR